LLQRSAIAFGNHWQNFDQISIVCIFTRIERTLFRLVR
jgi:hypothetical protein